MDLRDSIRNFDIKHQNNKYYLIMKRLLKQISEHKIFDTSAMLTYYFILSLFPFIIFLLSLVSYTPLADVNILFKLFEVLPEEIGRIIIDIIVQLVDSTSDTLLSVSIIFAIYAASKGVSRMIRAINIAYNTEDRRSFVYHKLLSIVFTIFIALGMTVLLITSVFGRLILTKLAIFLKLEKYIVDLINFIKLVLPFVLLVVILALLYSFGTDKKVRFKYVMPGAIFSTVVGIGASSIFAYYIDNFGKYNITYGSLGGIIVFLIWINLLNTIIVLGSEINGSIMYVDENYKGE